MRGYIDGDKDPTLLNMWRVLRVIPNDGLYYNFSWIESDSGVPRSVIKVNVKELRRLGFVEFARGLMSDENEVQGAGYAITDKGLEWLEGLLICETCERPRHIHICIGCGRGQYDDPAHQEPGKGCGFCRNTGWNQTPCLPPKEGVYL